MKLLTLALPLILAACSSSGTEEPYNEFAPWIDAPTDAADKQALQEAFDAGMVWECRAIISGRIDDNNGWVFSYDPESGNFFSYSHDKVDRNTSDWDDVNTINYNSQYDEQFYRITVPTAGVDNHWFESSPSFFFRFMDSGDISGYRENTGFPITTTARCNKEEYSMANVYGRLLGDVPE